MLKHQTPSTIAVVDGVLVPGYLKPSTLTII